MRAAESKKFLLWTLLIVSARQKERSEWRAWKQIRHVDISEMITATDSASSSELNAPLQFGPNNDKDRAVSNPPNKELRVW